MVTSKDIYISTSPYGIEKKLIKDRDVQTESEVHKDVYNLSGWISEQTLG